MDAKLIVVHGRASREVVELKLPTILGRSPEAQLTIGHPQISRQHCMLYESDGLLMLKDLGSTNGTFLDGQRVAEAALRPDDEFTIGPLTFRAVYDYAGDLQSIPPPILAEVPSPSQDSAPQFGMEFGPWSREPTPLDSQVLEVRIVPHGSQSPASSPPPPEEPAVEFDEVAEVPPDAEQGAAEGDTPEAEPVEPAPPAAELALPERAATRPPLRQPPKRAVTPAHSPPAAEPSTVETSAAETSAESPPHDPFRPSATDDLTLDDFLKELSEPP